VTILSPASTDRRFDLLGLGTFIIVGLPDGMLGTAWPAMRHSFGEPVGDLGLVLLVNTIGSVVVAAFVGRLIQRLGVSVLLAVAGSCAALGGIGYVAAPGLWLILAIGPLLGTAAGMMDGGLNTAIALTGRPRLLNLLHGFYGIGTAVGPLVVTAAILAGSWRPAYLLLVALDLTAAALWALHHRRIPAPGVLRAPSAGDTAQSPDVTDPAATWSRRRVVSVLTLGLIVFFVYTGLEVSAGQWETSYLRDHLELSASSAGLAAFGYWGALTAVRIGLALPAKPVPLRHVMGWGMAASVGAAALIWWQPDTAIVVAGFVILGAALAGVFPARSQASKNAEITVLRHEVMVLRHQVTGGPISVNAYLSRVDQLWRSAGIGIGTPRSIAPVPTPSWQLLGGKVFWPLVEEEPAAQNM
jgi:fucose permease